MNINKNKINTYNTNSYFAQTHKKGLKPFISTNLMFIRKINIFATMNMSNWSKFQKQERIFFCSTLFAYENIHLKLINEKIAQMKNQQILLLRLKYGIEPFFKDEKKFWIILIYNDLKSKYDFNLDHTYTNFLLENDYKNILVFKIGIIQFLNGIGNKNSLISNLFLNKENVNNDKNKFKILNVPLFMFTNLDWNIITILFKIKNIKLTGGNEKFKQKLASNQFYLIKNLELIYAKFEVESLIMHNMKEISIKLPYFNKYLLYLNKITENYELVSKFIAYLNTFKNYNLKNNDTVKHKNEQIYLIKKFKNENNNNLLTILFIIEILIEQYINANDYINLNILNYFYQNNNLIKYDKLYKIKLKYNNIQFAPNLYYFLNESIGSNLLYLYKIIKENKNK